MPRGGSKGCYGNVFSGEMVRKLSLSMHNFMIRQNAIIGIYDSAIVGAGNNTDMPPNEMRSPGMLFCRIRINANSIENGNEQTMIKAFRKFPKNRKATTQIKINPKTRAPRTV